MKTLETQFVNDDNTFTQIKRTDKAALYKRETLEGNFVSYEVFQIKTKDGQEIYPTQESFSKWAWCPILEDRANTVYDRINNGDMVIPDYDPITNTVAPLENDPSLEELMAEDETPTVVSVVESTPIVETNDDPTAPEAGVVEPEVVEIELEETVEPTVVNSTVDGGAVVTVAKVKKVKVPKTDKTQTAVIPTGEFTQAQFAVANGMPLRGAVWGRLDNLVQSGKLVKVLKQVAKGRPTAFYQVVTV